MASDWDRSDADLSRRRFLTQLGAAAAGAAVLGPAEVATAKRPQRGARAPHPKTPAAALRVLQAGNWRYRHGKLQLRDYSPVGERIASKQQPFAAILTCADSRISPELVFDVERGNLFVSRIAGNGVDVGTLGSTEYAVAVLGVKLVMVLGHSDCGAVKAALEVVHGTKSYPAKKYGAIGDVVDEVVPAVRGIPAGKNALGQGIVANARAQAEALRGREPIIAPAVRRGDLNVVVAVYDIGSGRVSLV
jgi:carbonic anhydrase